MFRTISLFSAAALLISAQADASTVFPARGYELSAYKSLSQIGDSKLCIAHAGDGANAMLAYAQEQSCSTFVFLGTAPAKDAVLNAPCLVVGGDLDGIFPAAHFAAARHKDVEKRCDYALIRGASHHSFVGVDAKVPAHVAENDLRGEPLGNELRDILLFDASALARGEANADLVAAPLVKALELEGSGQLGKDVCSAS